MTVSPVFPNSDEIPSTPVPFRQQLDGFRSRLDAELLSWLSTRSQLLRSEAPEALELAESIAQLLQAGGKRLRPALVYHGSLACGGGDEEVVWAVAGATELLHTYLLVHDDIMDRSDLRRGQPTAHLRFQDHHGQRGWPGDPGRYGEAAAILVGDLAYTYATELFTQALLELPPPRCQDLAAAFYSMCREVIAGQHLEMSMALERKATEEEIARILRLKSGAYSVQRPLELGAVLADASGAKKEILSRYGEALGEAFQLQDDILGMFGETDTVGKPVGGDLAEGKYTLLIHHACRLAPPEDRAMVEKALGRVDIELSQVEKVRGIIRSCGALSAVRQRIADRLEEALLALEEGRWAEPGRTFLEGLVHYLRDRKQ